MVLKKAPATVISENSREGRLARPSEEFRGIANCNLIVTFAFPLLKPELHFRIRQDSDPRNQQSYVYSIDELVLFFVLKQETCQQLAYSYMVMFFYTKPLFLTY